MSPEPLVSCAQAPPAKVHDGLRGREWQQLVLDEGTGTRIAFSFIHNIIDFLAKYSLTQGRIQDFSKGGGGGGGGGHTVSNITVMALSPRNVVVFLLKKGLQRGRGVTGTPGPTLATPLKPFLTLHERVTLPCLQATLLAIFKSSTTFCLSLHTHKRLQKKLVTLTGNFRVPKTLTLKTRPSAKPFL